MGYPLCIHLVPPWDPPGYHLVPAPQYLTHTQVSIRSVQFKLSSVLNLVLSFHTLSQYLYLVMSFQIMKSCTEVLKNIGGGSFGNVVT